MLSRLLLLIWRYFPRRARRVVLWRVNAHWIVAAYAIVPRHDTHVLLALHPHDHGQWRLPGGTLKRQEQPAEGLRRELWEELGLDVVSVRLIHSETHDRSVQLYYRVEVQGAFRPSLEVTGWRPWPLDALPADLWPQQRRAIMLAMTTSWRGRQSPGRQDSRSHQGGGTAQARSLCWPFCSSARSEGPGPSQGGSVITSETPVSTGGVQGSVPSFRGRMSQTASTAGVGHVYHQ